MRPIAYLAAALTLAGGAAIASEDRTPEGLGEIFCAARVSGDMAPVEALATAELTEAIATAEAQKEAWEKANPGDKPPLGDGIPWQSWPDYAAECVVDQISFEMDQARVWIEYRFPEEPDASFRDVLDLKLVDAGGARQWRLDNVSYATDGDLRTVLVSVFMD